MNILRAYCTKNQCYMVGKPFIAKGLMLHSVGCNQPSAAVFSKNFNEYQPGGRQICVHGFIDANNGDVYQTLPWTMRGWHGGGKSNDTHIGVEMCEPACIKYTSGSNFTCSDLEKARKNCETTYNSAVELFAYLCNELNLDPLADCVIISHCEGNKRGIASNHGDPEHLWRGLKMSYTMDGFRRDVYAAMGNVQYKPVANTGKPSKPSDSSFRVRVLDTALNIRNAPGLSSQIVGVISDGGVYTIVETAKVGNVEWGKLKSGAGWISLGNKYVMKL